ncbi:MFS transporter [Nonomuraea sp. NPDC049725]|uniref:MFS transporter n=1 Tax=Nonomuraea sp. NPDC049725 TaxID=3154508 RepID=UPI0034372FD1
MTEVAEARTGLLAPFRSRAFTLYFAGQLISQLGDGIYLVALPFIVFGSGWGADELGLVLAAFGIARLVAFPIGGTLADRHGARVIMLIADGARVVVLLGFALLVFAGQPPLWLVAGSVALFGLFEGMFTPASFAVLPAIVQKELLGPSNSLASTMQSIAMIAGPAAGGPVVTGLKSWVSLLVNAVTFVVSTVTLLFVPVRRVTPAPAREAGEAGPEAPPAVTPGWAEVGRHVVANPLLRMSLLVTVVVNLAYAGMTDVALPSFAISGLGGGPGTFGTIMAAFGVGSLLGALCGVLLLRSRRRALVALFLGVGQGAAIMCVPLGESLVVASAAMLMAAVLQSVLNVFYMTMLQSQIPGELLGRVMSLLVTCAGLAFPLSTVIAGRAVEAVGAPLVIVVAGLGVSLAFVAGFFSREYRRM